MDKAKTVKVRVLVAVDSDGNWGACGYRGAKDWQDLISGAADHLNGGHETQAWITADIPLPSQKEIVAVVESSTVVDPNTQ